MRSANAEVVHTYREGNRLTDLLANEVVHFAGTNITTKQYHNIHELPQQAQAILQLKRMKILNLRITKMQNKGFTQASNHSQNDI